MQRGLHPGEGGTGFGAAVFRQAVIARAWFRARAVVGLFGVVSRPGEGLHGLVADLEAPVDDEAAEGASMGDADS